MKHVLTLTLPLLLAVPSPSGAEVVDRSAAGFTSRTVVTTAAPPETAYASLVRHVSEWWDAEHTYSGDSKNLSIVAAPGGCWCEALAGGGGVEHGRVVNVAPGRLLRLAATLGPLQEAGVTGSLTWQFDAAAGGSRITVTYAVGGYYPGGLDKLADAVDAVLGQQVQRLKAHSDRAHSR